MQKFDIGRSSFGCVTGKVSSVRCSRPKFGRVQLHLFSLSFADSHWNKVVSEGGYAKNFIISRLLKANNSRSILSIARLPER